VQSLQEQLEQTAEYIKQGSTIRPRVGIVLGSGLGAFADMIDVESTFNYADIPNFSIPTVTGHEGQLTIGSIGKTPIAALRGRIHFYEGHSMLSVVFPVRTLALLGIETLILTNAAGGLNPDMKPGDFLVIDDHINLMGDNPLRGPNLELGLRFPDMTEPYDKRLQEKLSGIMKKYEIRHKIGVYCGVSGPSYETRAEVRYLRSIGGDAVGMSTVPESLAANQLGLKVCAVSCITNSATGISKHKLTHDEVTATAKAVEKNFCQCMEEFVAGIGE
jgi:purine-nucleoside phosphorylase